MAIMETARLKQVARLVLLGFVPSAVSFSASAASLDAAREISQTATWSVLNDRLPIVVPRLLPPQSRLAYANACKADIGTIPSYNCMTGTEIPITKNGVKQSAPLADDSCDKPVKLGLSNEGQCVPYTRLVDLSPANNSNVTIMAICRKYHASTGPDDPIFNDLAMIAHNRTTGATCFFQSPVDSKLDGTNVPSPMASTPEASTYWLEPSKVNGKVQYQSPGGISCTGCHDLDPFILSPWIQQVANLGKWDPLGKYNVDKFGAFSAVDQRPWVVADPNTSVHQSSKCTICHRIGGSSINVIAGGAGGLHAANGFPDFHGFMPPANADSPFWWPYIYNEAVFELTNCVNPAGNAPAAGCKAVRAGTIK